MKNVYIYCEGQTEESFVNTILQPYFLAQDIYVTPIVCATKRTKTVKYRGGVQSFGKIESELSIICRQHKNEIVTTMFDYYAMPSDTPDINNAEADIYKRIEQIEKTIDAKLGMSNLFFGLMLHEFESLLFSEPRAFVNVADERVVNGIAEIRANFETAEHINNSYETAPSKRLESLMPNYAKVRNGIIVSKAIGMDVLLRECKHFAAWIAKIRSA